MFLKLSNLNFSFEKPPINFSKLSYPFFWHWFFRVKIIYKDGFSLHKRLILLPFNVVHQFNVQQEETLFNLLLVQLLSKFALLDYIFFLIIIILSLMSKWNFPIMDKELLKKKVGKLISCFENKFEERQLRMLTE